MGGGAECRKGGTQTYDKIMNRVKTYECHDSHLSEEGHAASLN